MCFNCTTNFPTLVARKNKQPISGLNYSKYSLLSLLSFLSEGLLLLLQICVVIITNFFKFSKVKLVKLYSNSQGMLFKVNFALNLENCATFLIEKFLSKLLIISSILPILLETNLTQSFVS